MQLYLGCCKKNYHMYFCQAETIALGSSYIDTQLVSLFQLSIHKEFGIRGKSILPIPYATKLWNSLSLDIMMATVLNCFQRTLLKFVCMRGGWGTCGDRAHAWAEGWGACTGTSHALNLGVQAHLSTLFKYQNQ